MSRTLPRLAMGRGDCLYPRHARQALAEEDIGRLLKAGVDGFQIDDEFKGFIPEKH